MTNLFLVVLDFSGARTYSDELTLYFSSQDKITIFQVFLNCKKHKEYTITKEGNINFIYFPAPAIEKEFDNKYDKSAAMLLYSQFKHLHNVVFHANSPNHYLFVSSAKKLFSCPLVFTHHFLLDFYSYYDRNAVEKSNVVIESDELLKSIMNISDIIVCVTEFAKRTIASIYKDIVSEKVVIYNGKALNVKEIKDNIHLVKGSYGFNQNDRLILYAGQLEHRKGIDNLIRAFLNIKDKYPEIKLVIAGTGEYDKYFPLAQKCSGRICFTGKLDKDTLTDYYSFAEIGIIPSKFEQCSYVAIEMMQNKLPLIISGVPGLNELVVHGKTGLVCKVKTNKIIPNGLEADEADLAIQIEYLLKNKTKAIRIAQKAHESALNKHSLEKMGKETLKIYRKLIRLNNEEINSLSNSLLV
jgi:glycosyltransferase involved in cell wall biosynthesis